MKKWRIWLKRTAWVAMGLVLMCGTVGSTVKASDILGEDAANQPIEGEENNENTDGNEVLETSRTLIVKSFDSLKPEIQTQHLKAGEEPVLPDSLGVTVAIKEQSQEGEGENLSSFGALNTVHTVSEVSRLPEDQITLSGVEWDIASTSESNNGTTYNYTPVVPQSYGEHDVEVLNSLVQMPMIQAMREAAPAASISDGSRVSTPSNTDWDGSTNAALNLNGLLINGPENSVIWTTQTQRIEIRQPGKYRIKGTLGEVADSLQSTNPLIVLTAAGDYEIALEDLNIDITQMAYGGIFSIPSGANVKLSVRKIGNTTAKLTCINTDAYQTVIENNGTINLIQDSSLECAGQFQNVGTLTVEGESILGIDGDVTNSGKVIISGSSEMEAWDFSNKGELTISEASSKLTVEGKLDNASGGSVAISGGELTVEEGQIKKDNTKDWLVENSGTFKLTDGGTVTTRDTINNSGATLTINGTNTVLTTQTLKTGGELTINEAGLVKTGSLANTGILTIGNGLASTGTMLITDTTSSENTGTIVIESGSYLRNLGNLSGDPVLKNNGSLTIKKDDCLGTLGTNGIALEGEGEFIFSGLVPNMLTVPDDYELAYDGEPHTPDVVGNRQILDSTEEVDPSDTTRGAVSIAQSWPINNKDFQVKVRVELSDMTLTRRARNPEVPTGGGWIPGITGVDTRTGISEDERKDTVSVTSIQDPGRYTLVYKNIEDGEQKCSVGFIMTEWSMTINTSNGDDEKTKELEEYEEGLYAVYENKERISGTIQIAIYNEQNTTGQVRLYWDAYDASQLNRELVKTTREALPVKLNERGVGTVQFDIPTADVDYVLKPRLDPTDTDESHPTWDNEDYAYKHPYRLSAVYETGSQNRYYSAGSTSNVAHQGLIKDSNDSTQDFNGTLEGWYDDKRIVVIRRVSTINFTSNYYSVPHIYDGKAIRLPSQSSDSGLVDISIGNTNEKSPAYTWYKGPEAAVQEAYANKTTNVSGLENIQDQLAEKELEAPKDAGWYIIKAELPSTSDYMGYTQLQLIRIEPRNATITIDRSLKKFYGADDPKEWEDFVVTTDNPTLYIADGFLDEDVGSLKGSITRDDKGEKCGSYEVMMTTWVDDDSDPTKDNYRIKVVPGILKIEKRELEWDTEKMFLVLTDDESVSVVGGLKTRYRLEEGETEEDRATIEKNLVNDDMVIAYNRLDLSTDKSKITVDGPRPNGVDKDNYVIQNKSIPVSVSPVYKISVKAGSIDSTTLAKLKDGGAGYSTEQQVISELESQIQSVGQQVSRENIATYDIILTKLNGDQLTEEEIEKFPWGALTVTIPYPAGTSKSTSFVAAHMFTEDINLNQPGTSPGNVETRGWNEVARVDDGVRFQITSLSPVTIGWAATGTNNGGNNNDPNGGNGTNNGNNGSNNNNNGTNNGNNGNNSNNTNNTNNTNNNATNSNSTKATNSNTTRTSGVRTGDTAEIAFYMIATLIACLLLILIICLIRMQFRKKE